MDKKKICFVVASPGSARAFLLAHIKRMVSLYEVHLVANFPSEEAIQPFAALGVVCHSIAIERKISISKDLKALCALRKLFRKERFDCVHSVTPKAGLLSAMAGKCARIPRRIHIYTGQVWATRHGLMRCLLKFMDKLIATFDTHLLVDGESQRQFLIKEGVLKEKNSRVLANGSICGVNVENFNPTEETKSAVRSELKIADSRVVYCFMGRLNHDKGIGELYSAFNKLVADCPNAFLVLFGSDEESYDLTLPKYRHIVRGENYLYYGHTSEPFRMMQCGDVFVLPTWREGFGSSVIEASALCLPVICSDAYGVMDAMVEGETGLRCKVGDEESLYECMKKYYEEPELRRLYGQNGRRRVEEKFDGSVVTAAWVDFYNGLFA